MRKWLVFFVAGFFVLTTSYLSAATAAETHKLGIVDLFKALNESDAGKRAKADLESVIKSRQSAIDEKGKNIEKLKADMEKQAALLSAEAKKGKEEEIERLIRDYQRVVSDSQTEVKKKEGELTGSIIKEIRELIAKIGQEDGYTLILENAEGLVLYSDKAMDITEKVITRYNGSKAKESK